MRYRISELREICQKSRENGTYRFSPFERHFLRRLSIYLTYLASLIGISANAVSIFSIFVIVAAGFLFATGDLYLSLLACLLVYFFFILDCVDGEVARLLETSGGSGEILEKVAGIIFFGSVLDPVEDVLSHAIIHFFGG